MASAAFSTFLPRLSHKETRNTFISVATKALLYSREFDVIKELLDSGVEMNVVLIDVNGRESNTDFFNFVLDLMENATTDELVVLYRVTPSYKNILDDLYYRKRTDVLEALVSNGHLRIEEKIFCREIFSDEKYYSEKVRNFLDIGIYPHPKDDLSPILNRVDHATIIKLINLGFAQNWRVAILNTVTVNIIEKLLVSGVVTKKKAKGST